MNILYAFSNVFTLFGSLSYAIFQLTKKTVGWPGFIADNIEYISFGSIAIGYLLTVIFYIKTKNAKKAKQLLLYAVIITAVCFALYFLS